jgi:hypothetical protein
MLVDMVVRNHEVVAAKPTKEEVPPIILIRIESDGILPAIKWNRDGSYSWAQSLENRTFGRLKRGALNEAPSTFETKGDLQKCTSVI